MIPEALSTRCDKLAELSEARQLLAVITVSGVSDQQFLQEKIRSLEEEITESDAEAKRLISQVEDMRARLFADLHYRSGYGWPEIASIFGVTEDAAKSRVYRAFNALQEK